MPIARTPQRSSRTALWISAAGIAAAFVGLYFLAVRTEGGQYLDVALFGMVPATTPAADFAANALRTGLPAALAVVVAVFALIALRRRRLRLLATVATIVVAANLLSPLLRDVILFRPWLGDHGYTVNTFPSGHVTATASLALAAVLLWPWTGRGWAIVIAAIMVGVSAWSSVAARAHRPSDVIASILLVGAVACVTTALLFPSTPQRDADRLPS